MNYFEYAGVNSDYMGLHIEKKDVFSAPKYETEFTAIPGRNGDLISPNGRYGNVQVVYSVFLPAKSKEELADKISAVKAWLYAEPNVYHELRDTYDEKYFRKAVFASKLDIEDELNRIGVFTISFSCLPFRYAVDGFNEISVSSGTVIENPTAFEAKPYIMLTGNGSGTLTITSPGSKKSWTFSNIQQHIEIDSDLMNFYKGSTPENDAVEGEGFPILYPGGNTFTFSGGITGAYVMPRWVTL